ncbi:MAG: mandelate racemase/muconate lactonizing enzyme family protein [Acidobacteriota bacterium]|nr:MAG: mandelate racemase/muconate lactonizing enzyme family protein [Acidobacteriota bacterium]
MSDSRLSRRKFIRQTGLSALAASAAGVGQALNLSASAAEAQKIVKVEAITFREDLRVGGGSGGSGETEFWWLRLTTEQGLVGYGETYPFVAAEVGALEDVADQLLGRNALDISGIWKYLYHRMTMRNAGGAEMRLLSALNMAQLDILGKASELPLYRLLGGRTRDRIRVYNTTTDYWAINEMRMGPDTLRIVDFLLERGINAMKIYPFDGGGDSISAQELESGLKWIRDIRDRSGTQMDICVDCWGRWDLPSAQRIAKVLEPYGIMYLEDVMLPNSVEAYARLAAETSVPICMSETYASRYEYRELLQQRACDVVMYDLSWVGGPWEGKRISDMADSYLIPTSPHTCGGPLLYLASIHLCAAIPNFLIMESNYWKYTHQFPHFLDNVPVPSEGSVQPSDAPGLGAEIRQELFDSGDASVRTMAALD